MFHRAGSQAFGPWGAVTAASAFSIIGFNRPRFLVPRRRLTEAPGEQGVSFLPGERVSARLVADHIRDGSAYEGYLYVTSLKLVHVPWAASAFRGARPFGIPLNEVTGAVELVERARRAAGSG